jgi:hypothetical protein
VSIVTLTTISRLVPPEVEGNARLREQDLGHQADQGQVGGADHRDAGEHVVEIFLGALARADAGDEAAVRFRFSAVSSGLNCTEV